MCVVMCCPDPHTLRPKHPFLQLLGVLMMDGSQLSPSLGTALDRQVKDSELAQGHTVSLQAAQVQ